MMTERLFEVVCTRGGEHGRMSFPSLILHADGSITEAATRVGRAPIAGAVEGVDEDGEVVTGVTPRKSILPAESHRTGHGTWRWKCSCGLDVPVKEKNLRRWMEATQHAVFDISHVP